MKKHYLAVALMALALGMTACSSKNTETAAASAAAVTEAAGTESETSEEDSAEEDYFYGYVTEVTDKVITVTDDEGKAVLFDGAEAEVTGAEEIGVGDEVEITFEGELAEDVTAAKYIDIITSAAEEAAEEEAASEDESISGTVEEADDKTLTLKCDDGSIYTFNAIIAQKVSKDGIKAGVEAEVTYYGDLEDTEDKPVATKIVTEDAMDTEDADICTLTGTVAEVGSNYIVLDTEDPENTMFAFAGEEGLFDGIETGETVTVIYEGSLTEKTVHAVGLK